jgi:hypothetical protein
MSANHTEEAERADGIDHSIAMWVLYSSSLAGGGS